MRLRSAVVRSTVRLAAFLPTRVLQQIEQVEQLSQGKGYVAQKHGVEVAACLGLLPEPQLRQPLVVFDIGANRGEWSAALLKATPRTRVYAFEPSSTAAEEPSRRFHGDANVTVVNAAVGQTAGKLMLWADYPGSPLASLTKRHLEHLNIELDQGEEVDVVMLDRYCADHQVTPTILKLDVEGYELEVLKGSERVLDSVSVVQFEFGGTNIDARTYFQDFFYFFERRGFSLYRLAPAGLREIARYSEFDEAFQTTNFFAARRPH